MGFPYFNPPYVQKVNKIEEGNFFVPTGGLEPDSVTRELHPTQGRVLKILKTIVIVAAVIGVIAMGIALAADPSSLIVTG